VEASGVVVVGAGQDLEHRGAHGLVDPTVVAEAELRAGIRSGRRGQGGGEGGDLALHLGVGAQAQGPPVGILRGQALADGGEGVPEQHV